MLINEIRSNQSFIDDIVNKYSEGISTYKLSKEYECHFKIIQTILRENDVSLRTRKEIAANKANNSYSPSFEVRKHTEEILNFYTKENKNLKEISKIFNTNISLIRRILKENNVEIRPMSVSKRIYSLNEYSFDIIDSKEKAYVLGLFFADGYNSEKEGKIKITLLEQDKDILEKAKKVFETNRPLKIKQGTLIKGTQYKGNPTATLMISNKHLSETFAKLGVVSNKTFSLTFPRWLKEEYIKDFIRGYFDGDGSIAKNKNKVRATIISTEDFCWGIKNYLDSININSKIYHCKSQYVIEIIQKEQCKKFFDHIYSDSTIHGDRKYNRYYKFYYGDGIVESYSPKDN